MMIAIAISLAAVKTFWTLVASLTLKQLIKVIKPTRGHKRKEEKRLSFSKYARCESNSGRKMYASLRNRHHAKYLCKHSLTIVIQL